MREWVNDLLIFDVDGVITEPTTGEVELGVIDKIIEALKQSEPVAFNTGRGLSWIAPQFYFSR